MDNQPIFPGSSGPFSGSPGGTKNPLLIILTVILGLGAALFGTLAVMFYAKATTATNTLQSQKSAAVASARADQKKTDEAAAVIANGLPYRIYTAPSEFGSFEIKFPKNWSSYAAQERSGTQVNLALNPDFVRRTNGVDELVAARVMLMERTSDQFMTAFNSQILKGTLKKAEVSVSGLKATSITGQFNDKRTVREVVVPVRDKVIVFITENNLYSNQFNEILAQAKIIP